MNFFDKIVQWMDNGEHSFVTLLSKVMPLLVPLIPAYVGYSHVTKELGFNEFFGWTYGSVIEGLGYASIYKAIQFWENNRHYTKKENQAPLFVAIAIYLAYLFVTLSVNVLLDWQAGIVWWKVLATGGISLLSVPAGLLMSISAVHTERTLARERTANERKNNRTANKANEPAERTRRTKFASERRTNSANEVRQRINSFVLNAQANEHRTPRVTEIANELGVSKSYASETLQAILSEQKQEYVQ